MKAWKPIAFAAVAAALVATPLRAQDMKQAIINDIEGVAEKIVGLAETVPVDKYTWRPADDVRSIGEVYMHFVSANYFFPTLIGFEAPADTPAAWRSGNAENLTRAQAVEAINASFEHLYASIRQIDDLDAPVNLFGDQTNVRQYLVVMATHLHEHLGQSIAYARTNGIVPPWAGM